MPKRLLPLALAALALGAGACATARPSAPAAQAPPAGGSEALPAPGSATTGTQSPDTLPELAPPEPPPEVEPVHPTAPDASAPAPPGVAARPTGERAAEPPDPAPHPEPGVRDSSVPDLPSPPPPPPPSLLDLDELKRRVRVTSAIGPFTKLALKNEIDDLLDAFAELHEGRAGPGLRALRERFDLLVMKVVALLEDDDARLAHDVARSREHLWGLVSDPVEFSRL